MKLPKLLYSKLFLSVLFIALVITGAVEYRQWQQRRQIDAEIAALVAEEQQLQAQNEQLKQSISFLSSDEYKEKLARLQLNLKKEGEIVVNFPPEATSTQQDSTPSQAQSNVVKWWEYIFVN